MTSATKHPAVGVPIPHPQRDYPVLSELNLRWACPEDITAVIRTFLPHSYFFLLSSSYNGARWILRTLRDDGFRQEFSFAGGTKNFALYVVDNMLHRASLHMADEAVYLRLQRLIGPDLQSDWSLQEEYLLPFVRDGSTPYEMIGMSYCPSPPAMQLSYSDRSQMVVYYSTQEGQWKSHSPNAESYPEDISSATGFFIGIKAVNCSNPQDIMRYVGHINDRPVTQLLHMNYPFGSAPCMHICDNQLTFEGDSAVVERWYEIAFPLPMEDVILSVGSFFA